MTVEVEEAVEEEVMAGGGVDGWSIEG